jgi:hypothetical protein
MRAPTFSLEASPTQYRPSLGSHGDIFSSMRRRNQIREWLSFLVLNSFEQDLMSIPPNQVKALGAIENIEMLNRKTEGSLRTNVYSVTFKNRKAISIVILKDGKITSLDLRAE